MEVGGAVYIVAADLLKVTAEKCGWSEPRVVARFPGAKLDHAVFRHPFLERDSLGMLADHVTLEQGTGAVHTAPGHGQEDYVVGAAVRHGEVYCPVDAAGRFFHATGAAGRLPEELIGKTVWEANPMVIEILKARGALLAQEKLAHSYPHCWRCHKPVIFRATEQWFIGMERNDFRQHALEAITRVRWMPEWGEERISNMIASRPDWCISRQRVWGVPIIVFYCEKCREPVTDRKILDRIVELFREHSADVWYERTRGRIAAGGTPVRKCGGAEFSKENDILDVWFDSGSSHLAVLNERYGLTWPADLYMEGGDQYRGWFHSSLLVGVGHKGGSPYRACALNGWVLDGEGRAMHKSLGNFHRAGRDHQAPRRRNPAAVVGLGRIPRRRAHVRDHSDAAGGRLPQAAQHVPLPARQPARFRPGDGRRARRTKCARSTNGFCCAPKTWWRAAAHGTTRFEFHKVYHAVYAFATVDLSSIYFDVLKDRLYTLGRQVGSAAQRADGALPAAGRAGAAAGAPHELHRRRGLDAHGPAGERAHGAISRSRANCPRASARPRAQRAANWDRLMEVRDGGAEETGSRAQREADRRAARSARAC